MVARNRGGIWLSYQLARLHRLAEFIPGLHKSLKKRALNMNKKRVRGGASAKMGVVVQEEDRDGRDPLAKTDLSRDVKVIQLLQVTSTKEFVSRFLKRNRQ
jgi:hypothetical protein